MRIMAALTPEERAAKALEDHLGDLLTERARIDHQIRQALRAVEGHKGERRSRLVVPDCGSETAYQRHRHQGEDADEKCKAAHRLHNRVAYAQAKLREAS